MVLTYQPASRFWPFQFAEMGIFLAAALAFALSPTGGFVASTRDNEAQRFGE
jgi:hypothetical protein